MTTAFFLLRASEYLVEANRTWSTRRVVKACEIERRTRACRIQNAQEVVIYLTGSKTDQYNQGTIRNTTGAETHVSAQSLVLMRWNAAIPRGLEERKPRSPFSGSRMGRRLPVMTSTAWSNLQLWPMDSKEHGLGVTP